MQRLHVAASALATIDPPLAAAVVAASRGWLTELPEPAELPAERAQVVSDLRWELGRAAIADPACEATVRRLLALLGGERVERDDIDDAPPGWALACARDHTVSGTLFGDQGTRDDPLAQPPGGHTPHVVRVDLEWSGALTCSDEALCAPLRQVDGLAGLDPSNVGVARFAERAEVTVLVDGAVAERLDGLTGGADIDDVQVTATCRRLL